MSDPRPLSPHLQIYKPQWTSVLSILHRITGAGLVVSLPIFVGWLVSIRMGQDAFNGYHALLAHPLGQLVLVGVTFCFCYHLCNGIRHLAWDKGFGFDLIVAKWSGTFVVLSAVLMTGFLWLSIWGIL